MRRPRGREYWERPLGCWVFPTTMLQPAGAVATTSRQPAQAGATSGDQRATTQQWCRCYNLTLKSCTQHVRALHLMARRATIVTPARYNRWPASCDIHGQPHNGKLQPARAVLQPLSSELQATQWRASTWWVTMPAIETMSAGCYNHGGEFAGTGLCFCY